MKLSLKEYFTHTHTHMHAERKRERERWFVSYYLTGHVDGVWALWHPIWILTWCASVFIWEGEGCIGSIPARQEQHSFLYISTRRRSQPEHLVSMFFVHFFHLEKRGKKKKSENWPGKPQCRRGLRRRAGTAGGAIWSGDRFAVVDARGLGARTDELHAGAHQMMRCSSLSLSWFVMSLLPCFRTSICILLSSLL